MARASALFFRLELTDAIVYKITTAFVDFNFTFLFIDVTKETVTSNTEVSIGKRLGELSMKCWQVLSTVMTIATSSATSSESK